MFKGCERCAEFESGPRNFLLKCQRCQKMWHHRCHKPSITDHEIVARVRAFNEGKVEGLHRWICHKCINLLGEVELVMPKVHADMGERPPQSLQMETIDLTFSSDEEVIPPAVSSRNRLPVQQTKTVPAETLNCELDSDESKIKTYNLAPSWMKMFLG